MNYGIAIAARDRILLRRNRSVIANFAKFAKLAAILFSLVVLGLNMPKVSTLLFPVLVLLFAKPRSQFLDENILLFLFLGIHFIFTLCYGEIPLFDAIKYIIMGQAAYCLGVYIRWNRLPFWPYNTMLAVVAYGTGLSFFGFLSFQLTLARYAYLLPKRSFVAFWSEEIGNAIVMLDFFGIMIALVPAAMFGLTRLWRSGFTLFKRILLAMVYCGLILIGIEGLIINGYFQNRGPFVMLTIIASVVILYYLRRQIFISSAKTLLLSLGLGAMLYLILSNAIDIETPLDLISGRFVSQELNTSRYFMWGEGLKSLIANPLGGVVINRFFLGDNWFHNFWFDAGRGSGIIPLIFLVIFQIKHVHSMFTILRQARNILLEIIIISLGICMAFVYMYQPVVEGGLTFLFFTFFILGIIRYLGKEVAAVQEQSLRKGRSLAVLAHSRAHGFTMAGRGILR